MPAKRKTSTKPSRRTGRKRPASTAKPRRSPEVGDAILRGLTEFRDALAQGVPLTRRFTVRTVELQLEPRHWSPADVRRLREDLKASQAVFARLIGTSVKTVQAWEQGGVPPRMARRLLDCIRADPAPWSKILERAADLKRAA